MQEPSEQQRHIERLQQACVARAVPAPKAPRGRGRTRQQARRQAEHSARAHAVGFSRFVVIQGGQKAQAAETVHLSARTLRHWQQQVEAAQPWKLRGRPLQRSSITVRRRVLETLEDSGPATGLQTLRRQHPEAARQELRDLLERYRRLYALRHPRVLEELDWLWPGAVWAMDHAHPPNAIEGCLSCILSVRDLSSGQQLLWLAVKDATAEVTIKALRELLRRVPAPLVIKSDGGSAFVSHEFQEFLAARGVELLLSPPRTPRYNGSVESAIRWLKARTEHQAARAGRAGSWTREDMERAREISNTQMQAPGSSQRAPEAVWSRRWPLDGPTREIFSGRVHQELWRAQQELRVPCLGGLPLREQLKVRRVAVRRALVALGILRFRSKRISTPIKSFFAAKIS